MVGEWFPWSAEADYEPPKDVPPGGVSYHVVGHVSRCGGPLHFNSDKNIGKASHFVYTRLVGLAVRVAGMQDNTSCSSLSPSSD